jgi:hypothetical protein
MQVRVERTGLSKVALCDCGWQGKRRWFRGVAVVDAHLHSAETDHLPLGVWVGDIEDMKTPKPASP